MKEELKVIVLFKKALDDMDAHAAERILAYLTCYCQQRLEKGFMYDREEDDNADEY